MVKQSVKVIKVGGKIVEEKDSLNEFLRLFSNVSGHKLLVHGGGRSATKIAKQMGIETTMVEGRRITDDNMLTVVTMVYGGLVNKQIVAQLQAKGINALGITGTDMNLIRAEKRPVKEIDYGYVGDVTKVDVSVLKNLIKEDVTVVIAPLTHDGHGQMLNTNADTIAAEVAKALADVFDVELIYCFEKSGVLNDAEDDNSVIPVITPASFEDLIERKIVQGGMIPKLNNAVDAVLSGVNKVRITKASNLKNSSTGTIFIKED